MNAARAPGLARRAVDRAAMFLVFGAGALGSISPTWIQAIPRPLNPPSGRTPG